MFEAPTDAQKAFCEMLDSTLPERSCTVTPLFNVTIKWSGPTAPCVSGLVVVPLSRTAGKLAEGRGEPGAAKLAAGVANCVCVTTKEAAEGCSFVFRKVVAGF